MSISFAYKRADEILRHHLDSSYNPALVVLILGISYGAHPHCRKQFRALHITLWPLMAADQDVRVTRKIG